MAFSLCKGKCRARLCLLQSITLIPVVEGACCAGDTPILLPQGPQEHGGRVSAEPREANLSVTEQGTAN